jgi:hypothetical protein
MLRKPLSKPPRPGRCKAIFFQAREQAGAGLAGGFLYGKHKESEQKAYQQGYQAGQQSR